MERPRVGAAIKRGLKAASLVVLAATVVAGCTSPARPSTSEPNRSERPPAPTAPKRLTIAFQGDVTILSGHARTGRQAGGNLENFLNSPLVVSDDQGRLRPLLAQSVPSIENGQWKAFPDGRMEVAWRVRPGIKWHDGMPFSNSDVVFSALVERDKEVPRASRNVALDAVESVESIDSQTVVVRWNRPFIDADRVFTSPLPRHLLQGAYQTDKAKLPDQPYWLTDFVGTGPFRLREVARSSHLIFDANAEYVLGRPRLNVVEVKMLQDPQAVMANFLYGAVDVTLETSGLSTDQGFEMRSQWREGKVDMGPSDWIALFPQLLNPTPAILTQLPFRRALLHALDRQQMVDTLLQGTTTVAHSFLNANQTQYSAIEARLIRYEFDPRKAAQMIETLGYSRGPDGIFRDGSGQRLSLEARTPPSKNYPAALLSVADYWQRVGIEVEPVVIPAQRTGDLEYRATFPGFELTGPPSDLGGIGQLHSSKARVPENNFVGSNYSRYINADFDALIDRYFVTLPQPERLQVVEQIVRHIAENVIAMGMWYDVIPILIANRARGVIPPTAPRTGMTWNVHEWDLA